jgi:hypothetical protein
MRSRRLVLADKSAPGENKYPELPKGRGLISSDDELPDYNHGRNSKADHVNDSSRVVELVLHVHVSYLTPEAFEDGTHQIEATQLTKRPSPWVSQLLCGSPATFEGYTRQYLSALQTPCDSRLV